MRVPVFSISTAVLTGIFTMVSGLTVLPARTVRAETTLSLYGGRAINENGDLDLRLPGGTDLTFRNVSWKDQSFRAPIYYGIRLVHWFERTPSWGVSLDFTHAKMMADLSQAVPVQGVRGGSPVSGTEPLSDTFGKLEFSHGHNLFTAGLMVRRLSAGAESGGSLGRLVPYAGLGVGVAYPHVEISTGGRNTSAYQVAGTVLEGVLGVERAYPVGFSVFGEVQFSRADMKVELDGGGSVRVEPVTKQFVIGLSFPL